MVHRDEFPGEDLIKYLAMDFLSFLSHPVYWIVFLGRYRCPLFSRSRIEGDLRKKLPAELVLTVVLHCLLLMFFTELVLFSAQDDGLRRVVSRQFPAWVGSQLVGHALPSFSGTELEVSFLVEHIGGRLLWSSLRSFLGKYFVGQCIF